MKPIYKERRLELNQFLKKIAQKEEQSDRDNDTANAPQRHWLDNTGSPSTKILYYIRFDKTTHYCTPLQLAAGCSSPGVIELLISYGADPNYACRFHSPNPPLHFACRHKKAGNVRELLLHGADPNRRSLDSKFTYPIHEAVKSERIAAVVLILNASDEAANTRNHEGRTPLHYVYEQPDALDLLVRYGADINAMDQHGQSVLFTTVSMRCDGKFSLPARIMGKRDFDWTSIHRRVEGPPHCRGYTLLHALAANLGVNHFETVITLLAHGLDPHITNEHGKTAAGIASEWGNKAVLEPLETALIAGRCSGTQHHPQLSAESLRPSSSLSEPLSLQRWCTHAIRRDISLWDSASRLLPPKLVALVLGANWERFRRTSKLW